jgi:hypothetical protein
MRQSICSFSWTIGSGLMYSKSKNVIRHQNVKGRLRTRIGLVSARVGMKAR